MQPVEKLLPLTDVRLDPEAQARAGMDEATVEDYREAYASGVTMPPLDVLQEGPGVYWLWDGWHRYEGAKRARVRAVRCRVRPGTQAEARWLACGANQSHGLKRTNADKRRAVELALALRPQMSDRAIAEHCGVSHQFVANVRAEALSTVDSDAPAQRTGRDGRAINTGNIGRRRPGPADDGPPSLTESEAQEVAGALVDAAARGEAPGQPGGPVRDGLGREVPTHLRDVFGDGAARLAEQLARLRRWRESVEHAAAARALDALAPYNAWLKAPAVRESLAEAHALLATAEEAVGRAAPHAVCPRCGGRGAGCDGCRAAGFVPRWRLDELAEQDRLEGRAS